MKEEKSVLRWGGLAGMLGAAVLVLSLFIAPASAADPQQVVATFPATKAATIAEEAVYLAAIMLLVMLLLALYRALDGGRTGCRRPG
jgi:hypothetical protein